MNTIDHLRLRQPTCNKQHLTWSRDRRVRRQKAVREAVLSLLVVGAVIAVAYYFGGAV